MKLEKVTPKGTSLDMEPVTPLDGHSQVQQEPIASRPGHQELDQMEPIALGGESDEDLAARPQAVPGRDSLLTADDDVNVDEELNYQSINFPLSAASVKSKNFQNMSKISGPHQSPGKQFIHHKFDIIDKTKVQLFQTAVNNSTVSFPANKAYGRTDHTKILTNILVL